MSYRVTVDRRPTLPVYELHDDTTGASAAIVPGRGFNLLDLRLPVGKAVLPIIHAAPGFREHPDQRGPNGTPVLFPFPNRIRDGKFSFEGKDYAIPLNGAPNAIHGFAISAPWDVVEHRVVPEGATLLGQFQISKHAPERLSSWPADAILSLRYTLAGRRLTLEATITNPSSTTLPYGFGIHPYFRLPFREGGDPARTRVVIPATRYWVLQDLLPTGEQRPVEGGRLDFRNGQAMKDLRLDDVLTGFETGRDVVCRLEDENERTEFRITGSPLIREVVVYTPPTVPGVIAVEPYTQTTDAIHLQARGIDAGLRVLKHDEHESIRIVLETAG